MYYVYIILVCSVCAVNRLFLSFFFKYDIGGPGVIGTKLCGVVSWGPSRCGLSGAATVFTAVHRYRGWLERIFCKVRMGIHHISQKAGLDKIPPQSSPNRPVAVPGYPHTTYSRDLHQVASHLAGDQPPLRLP